MQIDDILLAKLEQLSHLRIDEGKKEEVKEQLTEILGYIENLNELDTGNLDAAFSTLQGGTPLREDAPVNEQEVSQAILKRAPQAEDDYFIVPAIIE